MAASPQTIEQCDRLLTITHNRYLAAIECADGKRGGRDELAQVEARGRALAEAAELWIQLNELLELRCRLPLQRKPND